MAAYLSMIAWTRNLDCVVLQRDEIVRFWGDVKRVEQQRIDWLKCDVKKYFPHFQHLSEGSDKFASVYLSRLKFPQLAFDDAIHDAERSQTMTDKGFITTIVSLPTELEMLTQLTLVIHGLADLPSAI
jgi:hypothetical protein